MLIKVGGGVINAIGEQRWGKDGGLWGIKGAFWGGGVIKKHWGGIIKKCGG